MAATEVAMARLLACVLLIACGGKSDDDRVPFVEDTSLPEGTEALRQACYDACDSRYLEADGCPAETGEALLEDCRAECVAKAPLYVELCAAVAQAYYGCIEDQDWLCAQGEEEPRLLDDSACATETDALAGCPI